MGAKSEIITKVVDGIERRYRKQKLRLHWHKEGEALDAHVPLCCDTNAKTGLPCLASCIEGSHYCRTHDPARIREKQLKENLEMTGAIPAKEFVFRYCKTLDPHDRKNPIKLIPRHPYLEKMVEEWEANQLVLVVKSRQMMASWLFTALHLWDAMYHKGRSIFFISKKEEDAGFGNQLSLLGRVEFILDNLPEKMRPKYKKGIRPPKVEFPEQYSSIMACSQEAEALRQFTASRVMSDEMAFQERAEQAYIAMKPTLDGGGCLTGISTPNGRQNLFYFLVNDIKRGDKKDGQIGVNIGSISNVRQETIGKGLWLRKNRNGFTVIGLHHSAHPSKTADWVKEAKKSYVSEDAWKQEQELDFTKTEGSRVYPGFKLDRHVRKLKYNPYRTIWRGWDFGYCHPATVWCQLDEKDRLCVLKDFMGDEVTINEYAKEVKRLSEEWFPGCTFQDAGDPAGRARTDKSEKTTVDILRHMGIKMKMQNSGVEEGINCIRGLMIPRADDQPGIIVDPASELIIDSFLGGYIRKGNEEPLKDGFYEHVMDALRYLVVVLFDVRTYRPYKPAKIWVPKHAIVDRVSGF